VSNTGRSVRAVKSEIVRVNGAQRAVRVVVSVKFVFGRYHGSVLETPPKVFPETRVSTIAGFVHAPGKMDVR